MNPQIEYEQKRDRLARQYQELQSTGQSVRLQKSVSNLFRQRESASAKLDVRLFNGVVRVDEATLTAEVEGMATYRTIVDATLEHGLLPAVVPELATITAGGAVSGGGIEASSFRFGLVHETVLEMDVLLPTGEVATVTPDNEYKDLFYGLANSFGTLGYILKLTIKLVRAKPYVELRHYLFTNMAELLKQIEVIAKTGLYQDRQVDFMEGVGFKEDRLYLTLGYFTDYVPVAPSDYHYQEQYFRSIPVKAKDYLTARDFIWRWDTDWFWCSKNFLMDRTIPRLLAGKWLLRSEGYWRLVRFDQRWHIDQKVRQLTGNVTEYEDIIQDVQIPIGKSKDFWQFFTREIPIRPVWFCPTRSPHSERYPLYELKPNQTYINFGFWDHVLADPGNPHYYNQLIETEVERLDGKKGLYSESYYEEKKFWRLYNGPAYSKLKTKYDPDQRLKNLYQKATGRA